MFLARPNEDDERYMRRALELARLAEVVPGASPIACVIVHNGVILSEGHNDVDIRHDAIAHAEVVAIQRAGSTLGTADLCGATLYTTLQPCGMCSMASIWSKIHRIVYGARREDVHHMYFEDRHLDTLDFIADAFREDLIVVGGVLREDCAQLYYGPADNPAPSQQGNV